MHNTPHSPKSIRKLKKTLKNRTLKEIRLWKKHISEAKKGTIISMAHKKQISQTLLAKHIKRSDKHKKFLSFIKRGMKNYNAKPIGTIHRTSDGYKRIKISSSQWKAEHIYLVEKYLKRNLFPGEMVHHIDETRDNNKLNNLYLFKKSGLHRYLSILIKNKIIPSNCIKSNLPLLKKLNIK